MKRYLEFINEQVDWNQKLVYYAVEGNLEGVKQALDNGADINFYDDYALRWASINKCLEVVKYLVEKGANVHYGNDLTIRWASINGYLDVVKCLVEHGANIHAENDLALRKASYNGHFEVVKYLCELIIENEPWYIPKIIQYMPDELKEKYPHLFAAEDMDLL